MSGLCDIIAYIRIRLQDLIRDLESGAKAYDLLRTINDVEEKINLIKTEIEKKDIDIKYINELLGEIKEAILVLGFTNKLVSIPLLFGRRDNIRENIDNRVKELVNSLLSVLSNICR